MKLGRPPINLGLLLFADDQSIMAGVKRIDLWQT